MAESMGFARASLNYNDIDDLIELPDETEKKPRLNIEAIAEYLYSKGTSSNSIQNLSDVIDDLQMIARWYEGTNPSEFERARRREMETVPRRRRQETPP